MRFWLAFIAPLLLFLPLSPTTAAGPPDQAPALSVVTLNGTTFDLAAERGHPVIVNFWATWCAPCRSEMPALNAYYRRHQSDGLVLIGLSLDKERASALVRTLAATVDYPLAMADKAVRNDFPAVTSLPVTYLIAADGRVRARLLPQADGLTEAQLATLVDPLLAKAR
jgi:thiol-disulfide isomerase/thioredoxin